MQKTTKFKVKKQHKFEFNAIDIHETILNEIRYKWS